MISVRGEAIVEAEPEIARLSVYVQSKDDDRRVALDQLVHRNQQCLDLIRSYGEAVERLETGGLAITPVLRYRRREGDIRHYQGTVWIKITVADLAVLGELVTRLADQDRVHVHGPEWALRSDSEVYARAARQAAGEAVTRARSYAEALGSRLTGLVELADEGLSSGGRSHDEVFRGVPMAAGMAAEAAEPESIDLAPQLQVVRAAVEARFTVTAPNLD